MNEEPPKCAVDADRGDQDRTDFTDGLPDRWCFGLAHPNIQRLIFLAGALDRPAE